MAAERARSFTRVRVERIIGLVVAVGCAVLGVQALLSSLDPRAEDAGWHPVLEVLVFLPLALMLLAAVLGRGQRVLAGLFAACYTAALIVWPVAASSVRALPLVEPWPFYLLNVGTVAAVLAFGLRAQIAVGVFIPVLWGAVRLVQCGFAPGFVVPALLDVTFAWLFAGILVTLAWIVRTVAARVDDARDAAVASAAAAAEAEATEAERREVGALMHDSVLAALIAAERADGDRARTLAAGMARDALLRLADAEQDAPEEPGFPIDLDRLADAIQHRVDDLGVAVRVGRPALGEHVAVPGAVALALERACLQAVANAVQHAQGAGLAVGVTATAGAAASVRVEVRDTGPGFDLDAVPADRLGIRASIQARLAAVGGRVRIDSDAAGTRVMLEWGGAP